MTEGIVDITRSLAVESVGGVIFLYGIENRQTIHCLAYGGKYDKKVLIFVTRLRVDLYCNNVVNCCLMLC